MAQRPRKTFSAQVLMRSASGREFTGTTAITSENIAEFVPDRGVASAAQSAFQRAGFETGPLVGVSFAITAPPETFDRFFKIEVQLNEDGTTVARRGRTIVNTELPLDAVPAELRESVRTVTFEPPAELFLSGADV